MVNAPLTEFAKMRHASNMTIREAADMVCKHPGTIYRYENGTINPDPLVLKVMAWCIEWRKVGKTDEPD